MSTDAPKTAAESFAYEAFLEATAARKLEDGVEDFAGYIHDKFARRLQWGFTDILFDWPRIASRYDLPDFKPVVFARLGDAEPGATLQLEDYGRLCEIDFGDISTLRDRPAAMGRAAARTLHKHISDAIADAKTPDQKPLFCDEHQNLLRSELGEESLIDAAAMLNEQTDAAGNRIGLRAHTLLVPWGLERVASRALPAAIATAKRRGSHLLTGCELMVDDYQRSEVAWQLLASPTEAPVVGVGFLEHIGDEPLCFYADPGKRASLGEAPEAFEGPAVFKVRHTWGVVTMDHRGAVGSEPEGDVVIGGHNVSESIREKLHA